VQGVDPDVISRLGYDQGGLGRVLQVNLLSASSCKEHAAKVGHVSPALVYGVKR